MKQIDEGDLIFIIICCAIVGAVIGAMMYDLFSGFLRG